MKSYLNFIITLFVITIFISCGNADDDISFDLNQEELGQGELPDECLNFGSSDLTLSIQDQFITLPSQISILFRVTDNSQNPVPGLTANQFTIFEQGRNDDCFNTISSSESFARISPNSQVFNNNTLLVLDLSNSVLQSSLNELQTASINFIANVMPAEENPSFRMAIFWFDGEDELHLLNPLTSSVDELTAAINSIDENISNDPSTDLFGAVIKATEIAEDLIDTNNDDDLISVASIVLFTDGTDQASRFSEDSALDAVNEADRNISFFTIGLGTEIDFNILQEIGKTASVVANDVRELETTFNQISSRVSNLANSFYLFEYCTPKRDGSGDNNLVIQVTNGAQQGAVQTSFRADGFTGGCK